MASSLFVVDYIVQVSTEVWHLSRQIQDGIFTFLLNNFEFEKSPKSKSKSCFEILGKKAFKWHLETWKNQIGSIFKLKIKKKKKIPLVNIMMGHPE